MRRFNKVIVLIGAIVLFIVLPVIAAIPDKIAQFIQDSALSFESFVGPAGGRLVVAAIAIVLWLLTIIVLWLEIRPSRAREIDVTGIEGGEARVSTASVSRRLEKRVASDANVSSVVASVEKGRQGVVAYLTLDVIADVDVPTVTASVIAAARDVLERQVGARVQDVKVRVREVDAVRPARLVGPTPPQRVVPEVETTAPVIAQPTPEVKPEAEAESAWAKEEVSTVRDETQEEVWVTPSPSIDKVATPDSEQVQGEVAEELEWFDEAQADATDVLYEAEEEIMGYEETALDEEEQADDEPENDFPASLT